MSEPYGAFLKIRIPRGKLLAWLDSRPRAASSWSDWRRIGGSWYGEGGPKPFADYGAAEYDDVIGKCDAGLGAYPTVRSGLRSVLDAAVAPQLKHASHDDATGDFVAGTPAYAENLTDFIVFLALSRGAASFLEADGHGVAAVHNYLFGSEEEQTTVAALRLGPGDRSEFMEAGEAPSAAFDAIVEEMLNATDTSPSIDLLDALK